MHTGQSSPWLVEADILFTKQKAYINRQGMNEHVFCLKTGIDDFKHESCRLYSVFLDLEMHLELHLMMSLSDH